MADEETVRRGRHLPLVSLESDDEILRRGRSKPPDGGTPPPDPNSGAGGGGAPGADGEAGEDGAPGPPGDRGPQGISGPEGAQGPPGYGYDGDDGEQGPPGERGSTGATGAQGADGPFGPPGFPGFDGEEGPEGLPGPPGATGAAGAAGATGGLGAPGPQGEDGEEGQIIIIPVPQVGLAFIEEQMPTGAAFTFSNLGAYRHLKIIGNARGDGASTAIILTFNGDTGNNYDRQIMSAAAATVTAAENLGINNQGVMVVPGSAAAAGLSVYGEILIPDYRGTAFHKMAMSVTALKTSTASGGLQTRQIAWSWRNAAAITSMTFTLGAGNFVTGSKFTLYGF